MPKNCSLMAPIEGASGKIAPSTQKRKRGGWGKFFGFRTLNDTGQYGDTPAPRTILAFYKNVRSTAYTAAELARFDKFAAVSRATSAVMKNPASLNTAMTEFMAQHTYKKLRAYVWHREWDNYQG